MYDMGVDVELLDQLIAFDLSNMHGFVTIVQRESFRELFKQCIGVLSTSVNILFRIKVVCTMPQQVGLLIFLTIITAAASGDVETPTKTNIVFTVLGRCRYTFDIFTLPIRHPSNSHNQHQDSELRLTDGKSINYNGFFHKTLEQLVYVTERNGVSSVYLDTYVFKKSSVENFSQNPIGVETQSYLRVQKPLLGFMGSTQSGAKDRPSITGDFLIYVSTHEDIGIPRKSWAAVYSTHLVSGETLRLTPNGVSDFSPAVSPSGVWTAVASAGEKGWNGEIEDLETGIYVFRTRDGKERVQVVEQGGWPCWGDEFTIYFHRKSSDDGWWSIYRAILPRAGGVGNGSVFVERVTPPGVHAFTPAASVRCKTKIAVATRRTKSNFRQIEMFDIVENEFVEVTIVISPNVHHYNPFISPDGSQIGYHRCRGGGNTGEGVGLLLMENVRSPSSDISLFMIDASFPSFSPNGDQIAYSGFPGIYVVNHDGSNKREVFPGPAFSTAWDWKRKGVVYSSTGPIFAGESTKVDVISINTDESYDAESNELGMLSSSYPYKKLTFGGQNNAFPSPSPDGKWIVFRSGRSGHKNLYIMDALEGERGKGFRRLTKGPWTDTMCNWSPSGEWIAFSSDRDNPGGGSFAIYFVHPDGTGLKKVVHSGAGGRTNHPWFSPDSKSFTFTSDYAAVSAEPIAVPHQYQPYGEIFVANLDGSGIQRLTYNSYEDGTPTWGPTFRSPVAFKEKHKNESQCSFNDTLWLGKAS